MKKQLNELMKEFIHDCKIGSADCEGRGYTWEPSFENFVLWLDGQTWDMKKQ